ncbi:MAG: SLC13 family permease [Calditrichia bacterium]
MDFPLLYTAFLLILMSIVLVKEWLTTEIAVFTTLLLLVVGKVVTVEEAFSGFSNIGVLSIAILFVVAGALKSSGALIYLNPIIFGNRAGSLTRKLVQLVFPVSFISAFTNNTPIVAMLIPAVRSWAEKYGYSISKFLIPVSYAAILGGMCTLIGTSTNLIVHGLLIDAGYEGFGFFEISKIGVPAAIIGLLFLVIAGPRLLPERAEPIVELGEKTREFVIELKVTDQYPHIEKTIEEAGLRHLKGLFLFQIERDGKLIAPVGPEQKIQLGDRLFFTGLPHTILELQRTPGLQLIKDSSFDLKQYDSDQIKTYEAVISASSPLVGQNVRESNFRSRYGAVIIAIHRNGTRIQKKIGDIVLHPGDTLLLLADQDFKRKWYHSNDFYLISTTTSIPSKAQWQAKLAIFIFALMIILTVLNILPLISAAGLAAIALVLTGCISPGNAKSMIDWKVLLIIAAAFGIGHGIENSGLAALLAEAILDASSVWGSIGVLIGVYLVTSVYTNIITNNATAALLFPIGIAAAHSLNADVRPFALAVTIAAAASFATPISYQTNLMVYGPGGYKFKDYLRIGIPMQTLVGIVAVGMISLLYF